MNRMSVAIVIVGLVMLGAGFIPLTRTVTVTEEKVKEVIEYREETTYREETKTKEEPYTEEVTEDEIKEEVLLRESIDVKKSSTHTERFELTAGEVIIFNVHSEGEMLISFKGVAIAYISIGKDFEAEVPIEVSGEYTLTYSTMEDATIDFDIVKTYTVSVVKTVEKTRTVTCTENVPYTEEIPYTVEVPYTEDVSKKETYTLDYLKYVGIGITAVGLALFIITREQKG